MENKLMIGTSKPSTFPLKAVLLTASIVSAVFAGSYYVVLRPELEKLSMPASHRSIGQNIVFQNRVTIISGYLTLTTADFLMGSSGQGLYAKVKEMQSRLSSISEYGISKESIKGFWQDYAALRSDKALSNVPWLYRTRGEVNLALAGSAFIELYSQDLSRDKYERMTSAVEVLKSYKDYLNDVEPSEELKAQIHAALGLVNSIIQDSIEGYL